MTKRLWLRFAVTLRQSRVALGLTLSWLLANTVVFAALLRLPWKEAALAAVCIQKADGSWGRFYASFTEVVVFGAVASLVVANATRRYRPEATSAALAERASGHLLVIGYTNLGKRLRTLAAEAGATAVVVESDPALVDDLVRAEEPVVLGSARDPGTLAAARVDSAAVVVIATDDLETAAVACRLVRDKNPRCALVVRCFDDDVGQILAKAYDARALSTSKIAARFVLGQAQRAGTRRALVVGRNNVGTRVAESLSADRIACEIIPAAEDVATLQRAGAAEADLIVIADDDLGKNLVRVDRLRDLNPNALVVCRVFHDDAAEILTQRPFRCLVLSTSRLAARMLADEGILRGAGIAKAPDGAIHRARSTARVRPATA
ncbi:MAG: NAD-binding protein [Minicystis sp.]